MGPKKVTIILKNLGIFIPLVNGVPDPTQAQALNDLTKSKLNQDTDQTIKDTIDYKKSLPLKERREFNVCNLPIGNIVKTYRGQRN